MLDDLSRPARLPSEAIALPAMESPQERARGSGALSAIRRSWPSAEPEQRAIGPAEIGSAADPVTMGRAALHSVRSGVYRT